MKMMHYFLNVVTKLLPFAVYITSDQSLKGSDSIT